MFILISPCVFTARFVSSAPLIRAVTQALLKTLADPAGDILPKVALENEDYNEDDEGDTVVFQPRGATQVWFYSRIFRTYNVLLPQRYPSQAIPLLAAPMANVLPNTLIRSVTAIAKPSDKSPFSSWNSDTSGESHGDLVYTETTRSINSFDFDCIVCVYVIVCHVCPIFDFSFNNNN